ncbi:GGDEF domain-containing protein [Govanella unica]|uniref:diguanylate cyclase n=1 Tax=Govanella unica TaxID=2975056 RepID=A0A9X3Z6X2_9PROT|nr:GGDEF domain-containing protein [Govania unica]MDA5193562.1 GGDEF domain-containing protein [Govania unica]
MSAQNRAEYTAAADLKSPTVFADQAMTLMALHGISPIPMNYQLWFTYFTGQNAALSQELNALLASTPAINDHLCAQIYARHFNPQGDDRLINETNQRVQIELEHLIKQLQAAEHDTSRFGNTLMGYSDSLAKATDTSTLHSYLATLISETRDMEEKSRGLEGELKNSSREIERLKVSLEAARTEALTDQLTNIGNRKLFEQSLHDGVTQANATQTPLAMIFCDVDHFKKFNDNWGHKLGDHVLRLVAQQLKDHTPDKGTPSRFGGEEFAILLPSVLLAQAAAIAENLRLAISTRTMKTRTTGVNLGRITMSYGVALYVPGESPDSFVARADRALYAAKARGRNCVITEDAHT